MLSDLSAFLEGWTDDPCAVKPLFMAMHALLNRLDRVSLEWKSRPGISHSLRARHEAQKKRELFVLIDIIDDDPKARWLSLCFYADMTGDPEEQGDLVPGGLLGEDARCFDIDSPTEDSTDYVLRRLEEAAATAGSDSK